MPEKWMPEPFGEYEYDEVATRILKAWRQGHTSAQGPRLVATIEAARREAGFRRAAVADLWQAVGGPCPPPDILDGYGQCPCGQGTWPCTKTTALWRATGTEPADEIAQACRAARTQMETMHGS